jgi:hypothetical protein
MAVSGMKPSGLTSGMEVLSPGSGDATLPHAAAMKPKADRIRTAFFIRDLAMKTRPAIRLEAS